MRGVYLIHFEEPYKHARHYTGYSEDIDARWEQHQTGRGARLTQVVHDAGIAMRLVRRWPYATRAYERRLKGLHARVLCPVCNPFSAYHYPTKARPRKQAHDECPF